MRSKVSKASHPTFAVFRTIERSRRAPDFKRVLLSGGTEENRRESHNFAFHLADAPSKRWAGSFAGLVRTATLRAVTSTVGNGIVLRGWSNRVRQISWRCRSCAPVALFLRGWLSARKAGVVRWLPYFAPTETCHGRSRGFLTCSPHLPRRRKLASVNCHL